MKRLPVIKAIDLFCGAGGLTHGLMRGGIKVVAGVDLDPQCRYPFEVNNNAKFFQEDVDALNSQHLVKLYGRKGLRLLAGCAPCQPFSTYSQKRRNSRYAKEWPLISSFGRLVKEIQPDLIAMENVPQLANHDVFRMLLESFDNYHVWWKVINCAKFGVPQTRKRLVLMGSKLGVNAPSFGNTNQKNCTVREAIASLPPVEAGVSNNQDNLHVSSKLSAINIKRIQASVPGGTWRDWDLELLATCHRKLSGITYPSVYGRMEWDKPSPTITTQCFGFGNGRFGHPEQDRAISLREAAILQTFPRDYKFVPKDGRVVFNKLGRLIGNAVPVRIGEIIATALIDHVKEACLSSN